MNARRWMMLVAMSLLAVGCDGKDPERLNRVGKKLVEKSRHFADDANLPQVTITRPAEKKSGNREQKTENRQ
jgi:hypothetical protein